MPALPQRSNRVTIRWPRSASIRQLPAWYAFRPGWKSKVTSTAFTATTGTGSVTNG